MQYTAIVKNLIGRKPNRIANILITGFWSQQNYEEISKFCKVNVVANNISENDCTRMVDVKDWKIDPEGSFFCFCCNETVNGFEFDFETFPWHLIPGDMPVIGDMSSSIATKDIPYEKFGMIYMGA